MEMAEKIDFKSFVEIRMLYQNHSIPLAQDEEALKEQSVNCKECMIDGKEIILSDPFVGENYGKPVKIVFMGIDTGEADAPCVFERRRQIVQQVNPSNPHLRGTIETILLLRDGNTDKLFTDNNHKEYAAHSDLFKNIVLMNAAKCCVKDGSMNAAPVHFYEKCKKHIIKELNIFQPDLIVTQGNPPWDSLYELNIFENDVKKKVVGRLIEDNLDKNVNNYMKYPFNRFLQIAKYNNGHKALVIGLPHPSARSRAWKDVRECFLPYMFSLIKNKQHKLFEFASSNGLNPAIFEHCFGIHPDSWDN